MPFLTVPGARVAESKHALPPHENTFIPMAFALSYFDMSLAERPMPPVVRRNINKLLGADCMIMHVHRNCKCIQCSHTDCFS